MFELDSKIDFQAKRNDILTVGELLVDMITAKYDDNINCDEYHRFFGGSPANIAMNVKMLGIESLVVSAVGNDGFGKYLINHLRQSNINTSYIQQVDYASTSLVVVSKSKTSPIPIFYRSADYQLLYTQKLEEAVGNSKIIHFSNWPISMEPARYTIEKVIELAKNNNSLICFDPNYHPMLWQQGEDGKAYVKSILCKVDIIKPSEDDAERLFGKDSPENQVENFLKLGVKLVVMTLGENGAIISNGKESIRLPALATEVVDVTGAGDAFWSGFYTALIKGYSIRNALSCGMAVSAYKLQYVGAVVNLPELEEIIELYKI